MKLAALAGEGGPSDAAAVLRRAGLNRLDADGGATPGDEVKTHASLGFGAVFAEVRVDPDFGTIRVPCIVGAYDAGRIVNPKLAHSQCVGGMVGGIGMALLEEAEWDPRFGRVVNANLAEYLIPVCADIQESDAVFIPGADTIWRCASTPTTGRCNGACRRTTTAKARSWKSGATRRTTW